MGFYDEMKKKMQEAALNGKGKYMAEGQYLVKITAVKYKEAGFKGKSLIINFEVLESSNPSAHAVGSGGDWVLKPDKPQAWGDYKAFIFATLMGVEPKRAPSEKADPKLHAQAVDLGVAAFSPDDAVALGVPADFIVGETVKLDCVLIKTQAGRDFTVHNWSPVKEEAAGASAA